MNQRLSGNEAGLVGYWLLNEQADGVTDDQSSSRNHGRGQGQLFNNQETIVNKDPCAQSYTVYYTSATPSEKEVSSHEVKQLGVQTVTVSADKSLLLFNLDISLEWDARQDQFMRQLEYDLRRVSELLYDWTDGQAALGAIFYLTDQEGKRVIPSKSTRAYLFRGEQQIISLGSPVLDQVIARGASPGERLCLYDLEAERLGCEQIKLGDEQIELKEVEDWQPDVIVSPVTSQTIEIEVAGELPKGVTLEARFFGIQNHITQTITLTPVEDYYTGTFELSEPTLAAYIHVRVVNDEQSREIVTSYGLGGHNFTGALWGWCLGSRYITRWASHFVRRQAKFRQRRVFIVTKCHQDSTDATLGACRR